MPQFDKITFFNQIFWLILSFFSFYLILLKGFLPLLAATLKSRKKLVTFVFSAGSSLDSLSKKSSSKNFQKLLKTSKTFFSGRAQEKLSLSGASKPKLLTTSFFHF